jgi:FkbM family methyltransferase
LIFWLLIGDFGLYAAACGCQVYMFEVQPNMVDVIQTSISINNFSSSRVHIINKAVSDLPSNSQLTFSVAGGDTTATNGSLKVSTIRLDDIQWPLNSTILLLKIDVEGFELNVLRSAEKLFHEKRIQHLIFEYTAYWTDRSTQKYLLPFVQYNINAKKIYALHRTKKYVYGPLNQEMLDDFEENHRKEHLQTDIYATFIDTNITTSIKAKPYDPISSFA